MHAFAIVEINHAKDQRIVTRTTCAINPLSGNPTKWSITLIQFLAKRVKELKTHFQANATFPHILKT